jgi:hypothetical protein
MALPTVIEKLQLKDEKNLLIQGLPSSVEKQFAKITFAKNVTPLLKIRRIDFAIVFALSQKHLCDMLNDVVPALADTAKFWVAFPKKTAKIACDLSRYQDWSILTEMGYELSTIVELDTLWNAAKFKRIGVIDIDTVLDNNNEFEADDNNTELETAEVAPQKTAIIVKSNIDVPDALVLQLKQNKAANETFNTLAASHKKEYIDWILSAKKDETRMKRIYTTVEKLAEGKKTHSQK